MTRLREMEEGETGYPMAREDRETAVIEGGRGAQGTKRAEEALGLQGDGLGGAGKGGAGAGCAPRRRTRGLLGLRELTHLTRKRGRRLHGLEGGGCVRAQGLTGLGAARSYPPGSSEQ